MAGQLCPYLDSDRSIFGQKPGRKQKNQLSGKGFCTSIGVYYRLVCGNCFVYHIYTGWKLYSEWLQWTVFDANPFPIDDCSFENTLSCGTAAVKDQVLDRCRCVWNFHGVRRNHDDCIFVKWNANIKFIR